MAKQAPPVIKLPAYTLMSVAELVPFAENSKTHSPHQIALLTKSLREFGWTNPVLIDGARGIIAGHGRVMAAKALGLKEVPTLELSHLTPLQVRAYVVADNRLAEVGSEWDVDMLVGQLGMLHEEGFDLTSVGYTEKELDALVHGLEPPADELPNMDEPEAPGAATIKVTCPQEMAGALQMAIEAAIHTGGFVGARVA